MNTNQRRTRRIQKAVENVKGGASYKDAAKLYKVCRNEVAFACKKEGIVREPGKPRIKISQETLDEVRGNLAVGLSMSSQARWLGIARGTLVRRLANLVVIATIIFLNSMSVGAQTTSLDSGHDISRLQDRIDFLDQNTSDAFRKKANQAFKKMDQQIAHVDYKLECGLITVLIAKDSIRAIRRAAMIEIDEARFEEEDKEFSEKQILNLLIKFLDESRNNSSLHYLT